MVKQGQAEYNQEENTTSTTTGTSIVVYWKSVNDWISLFGDWLDSTGQNGAVLTFYELSKGDLVTNQEFYNIHPAILNKVIDGLVSRNRVVLMKDGNKTVGIKVL
jgi:ESCRT-II complex subunit VPS25